ncbi:MAG TPA: HAMP domain-containing sensor histidine kinase [Lacipirellulaceae bacterium]|jgi:signal transduction histidine kinase|nr:HAMP domain-containing sensor histidine kinase [Lacipirellulaceae bacterium]
MIRPWQVWLVFAVCVLGAAGAMAWLTRQAVEADRARREAHAEAEQEQRVSLAVWRMDTELAPIIADEVIRPAAAFHALATTTVTPPAYVLLQFQVAANGRWQSPQSPSARGDQLPQLVELARAIKFEQLAAELPNTPLPTVDDVTRNQIAMNTQKPTDQEQTESNFQFVEGNRANAPPKSADDLSQKVPSSLPQKGSKEADFQQRSKRYQSAAEQNFVNANQAAPGAAEQIGVSRPIWIGDRLLLARRLTRGGATVVQGSWLDWPKLKAHLLDEATDLLPKAELVPVVGDGSGDPSRMLAGLPVRLVVEESAAVASVGPTLRWALWMGWGAVLLAVAAAAALLHGVMTLSERRAAFVSSVTHELRTPLTTFRMYAEMLARGMVPDAERRQEYFETLQRESERLSLLVENVLAYARLERGRKPQAQDHVTLAALLDRIGPRLTQRAAQAGMECEVRLDDAIAAESFTTDAGVVEQILFNLVDNAAKYARHAADRQIHVEANRNGQFMKLSVRDHGPGIGKGAAERSKPFEKSAQESAESAPGVGLGLALCRRLARQLGGRLEVAGANGEGATVTLLLPIF